MESDKIYEKTQKHIDEIIKDYGIRTDEQTKEMFRTDEQEFTENYLNKFDKIPLINIKAQLIILINENIKAINSPNITDEERIKFDIYNEIYGKRLKMLNNYGKIPKAIIKEPAPKERQEKSLWQMYKWPLIFLICFALFAALTIILYLINTIINVIIYFRLKKKLNKEVPKWYIFVGPPGTYLLW